MKLSTQQSIKFLSLFVLVIILASCGGKSNKESQDAAKKDALAQAEMKISKDLSKVLEDLPPPTEVPYLLQATGSDFSSTLINGLERVPNYETNQDEAALNLGVYATDMGYLLSYGKTGDSQDYLIACQKLAEALGVASVFDVKTLETFQENLNNPDTLNKLLISAIADAEMKLESSDRISVAALVLSGSFIEGLYLAVKTIEDYPKDVLDETNRNLILEPLVRVVLDQKKPLISVISMLKDLDQDEIIATQITELNILKALYDSDLADIEKQISENTGNFILTQDMLIDVTTEVKRIRKDIVDFQ